MFKFNKNKSEKENVAQTTEEEWIWVDGFKGTDKDMKCQGFQYEIGKHYIYDGRVEECICGYHLCKSLSNVFYYYTLNGKKNRFFKVRALVKKQENDNYGMCYMYLDTNIKIGEKLVAKEIIFQEEVSLSELLENINIRGIDNIEDMQRYIQYGNGFINEKMKRKLADVGYSKLFSQLIVDRYIDYYDKAIALKEQGVSNDMCAYILLTK